MIELAILILIIWLVVKAFKKSTPKQVQIISEAELVKEAKEKKDTLSGLTFQVIIYCIAIYYLIQFAIS